MLSARAIFLGVFNKTIISLTLVGYERIIANSLLLSSHIQPCSCNNCLIFRERPKWTRLYLQALAEITGTGAGRSGLSVVSMPRLMAWKNCHGPTVQALRAALC